MKINPLDPIYLKGFNDGTKHGEKQALEKFYNFIFYNFITERMATIEEVEGIGDKTAWKIHKHLLDGMVEEGDDCNG